MYLTMQYSDCIQKSCCDESARVRVAAIESEIPQETCDKVRVRERGRRDWRLLLQLISLTCCLIDAAITEFDTSEVKWFASCTARPCPHLQSESITLSSEILERSNMAEGRPAEDY
jgi:hypothetical protein